MGRFQDEVENSWHDRRFKAFREMHKVREFQLVLRVEVWDRLGEYAMRLMEDAVAAERVKRGFDNTSPEPLVILRPRGSSQEFLECVSSPLIPWFPL